MRSDSTAFPLYATPPFDLRLTVEVLRRRVTHRADVVRQGEFRRVLHGSERDYLIGVRQRSADQIQVRTLNGAMGDAERDEVASLVQRMLGLRVDLSPVLAHVADDPVLGPLVQRFSGMKPPRFDSLWTTFLSVVPFQQVSLDAGTAALNRIIEGVGNRYEADGDLYYAFPTAEQFQACDPARLRAYGLSAAKVKTLLSAAAVITSGNLTEAAIDALSDDAAVARLIELPGIGPWSANVILLRGFRRLSFFPQGDAGADRNFRDLVPPVGRDPLLREELLLRLGPWRGYLYFLLLAWKRNLPESVETFWHES